MTRIATLAGLSLVLAACAREAPPMTAVDPVSLTAAFAADAARLEIRYRATNSGSADVFLTDIAVSVGPKSEPHVEPPRPRAIFAAPDVAVFSAAIAVPPPGTLFAAPPRYYVNRLKAGTTRQGVVSIPLPAPADREADCRQVRFVLGVIPDAPELEAQQQVLGGVAVWRLGPRAPYLQREVAAEAQTAVPVRLRPIR